MGERSGPAPASEGGPAVARFARRGRSGDVKGIASCLSLTAAVFLFACDKADDGRSVLRISLGVTPPASGTGDLVWIAEGAQPGGGLLVDVLARDISVGFDGFNVELSFDPLIAAADKLTSGGALLGCTALPVLAADNISNGNANATGSILFSEVISGPAPPPCTLAGTVTLARILFRPRGQGATTLPFVPYNGNASSPAGSRLFRRDPADPDVGVGFFDGSALIEVGR